MKRLIAEVSDDLMTLFKEAVSFQDIAEEVSKAHSAYIEASDNGQQLDEENYQDVDSWFDEYYTSVVPDCLERAKQNYDFKEKYAMAEVNDIESLNDSIAEYIFNNKANIFANIQE